MIAQRLAHEKFILQKCTARSPGVRAKETTKEIVCANFLFDMSGKTSAKHYDICYFSSPHNFFSFFWVGGSEVFLHEIKSVVIYWLTVSSE